MPGTENVRKQTVLGGAAGIALLTFALVYRFYPSNTSSPQPPVHSAPITAPALTIAPASIHPAEVKKPSDTVPVATAAAQTTPSKPPTREIAALLKKAATASAAGRFVEPKESSALAIYQKVLAADKDNTEARAGIGKIRDFLTQQAAEALDRADERAATRSIDALATLPDPGEELSPLQGRLKTLKQVLPLLTRAADMLLRGQTTNSAGDNALAVYRHVLTLDPDNKLADQGLAQIERGYLDRALAAAAQDDFAGADKILADAAKIRPGSHELLDTRTRIEGIRREQASNILAQANSALDAGNPDLAERLAKRAVDLSPDLAGVEEFNQRLRNARLYASFSPGQVIVDKFLDRHGNAPALVVIPTGSFMMGSAEDENGHRADEGPQRLVKIGTGFALGRNDVSVGQYRLFADDSGYSSDAGKSGSATVYDEDTGRIIRRRGVTWRQDYLGDPAADDLPVINVSWNDANAYVQWLSARTGKHYRLPSEAEFEYALRAGSTTRYPWGNGNPTKIYGNFTGDGDRSPRLKRSWAKAFPRYSDGYWGPAPVDKFAPNAFGLIDINGNVSDWMADCWHDNYTRAPTDSAAWMNPGCVEHVIRGGSWGSAPDQVRSAYRISAPADTRSPRVGMRVARDL